MNGGLGNEGSENGEYMARMGDDGNKTGEDDVI